MAQLAIKGHPTRGDEVIEILEMLGGKTSDRELYGNVHHYGYYIQDKGYVSLTHCSLLKNAIVFTLEEFLERFPYKVGDKVIYKGKGREITKMVWEESTNTVAYKLDDKLYCNVIDELQPYKEENMEEKLMPKIDFSKYCKDKYLLDMGDYEIKVEDSKTYAVRKKPQYPKTYEECCEILIGKTDLQDCELVLTNFSINQYKETTISYKPPHIDLINDFYKLLICRDAYWKIAGEQMGLSKPWQPDWLDTKQDKYVIFTNNNTICSNRYVLGHNILAFPTEEMRDAFFKNFEELIKKCISLL